MQTWKWFHSYLLPIESQRVPQPHLVKDHNWPKFTRDCNGKRYFQRVVQSFAATLFGEDKPWRLISTQYRYGLVVRTNSQDVEQFLKGYLVYQTSAAAARYRQNGGQSLVQPVSSSEDLAVMVGPLSLVNHSCVAPYGFVFPADYLDPVTRTPVTDCSTLDCYGNLSLRLFV